MAKARLYVYDGIPQGVSFECPGCGYSHMMPTPQYNGYNGKCVWGFNDNFNKPTFTPSILYRTGHYIPEWNGKGCWCSYNKEHPDCRFECVICHSFVTDGKIQFLTDCTHHLAGKIVELPDIK